MSAGFLHHLENLEKMTVAFPAMESKNYEKYHVKCATGRYHSLDLNNVLEVWEEFSQRAKPKITPGNL